MANAVSDAELWTYDDLATALEPPGSDVAEIALTGFGVEALDGVVGTVADATYDLGASVVVVDTGSWILGRRVLLPAGVVSLISPEDETVYVDLTREQIRRAPERAADEVEASYRDDLTRYYGPSRR